jgi:D-alanyl-lipoteichoic acid acyltransferase DltB (MBOAT superfamily)
MLFNSIDFLIFFPIVTSIFFLIPRKARNIWLLLVSYYFYACWNPRYTVLIAVSTVITYGSGLAIGKCSIKYIISDYLPFSMNKVCYLLNASQKEHYINSFIIARRSWEKMWDMGYGIYQKTHKQKTNGYL